MPIPNTIEYSTSTQSGALRKGNFYLGVTDQDYGPTEVTGFYNGVTFSSGYLSYIWDGSQIRYNYASNDSQLISFLSSQSGTNFSTLTASLLWSVTQSTILVIERQYENLVTNGLVLNLDGASIMSYPKTGTTWYDSAPNKGVMSLVNGPSFSTDKGGCLLFDGTNDYATIPNPLFNLYSGANNTQQAWTVNAWVNLPSASDGVVLINGYNSANGINRGLYLAFYTGGAGPTYYLNWASSARFLYGGQNRIIGRGPVNVTFTLNCPNSSMRNYINGAIDTVYTTPSFTPDGITQNLYIAGPGNTAQYSLYSMQIYSRQLTDLEVLQNYQALLPRFYGYDILTNGLRALLDPGYIQSFTTASNTWFNVSGTFSNATLFNGVTYSATQSGSLSFDGVNDYVEFSSNFSVGPEWSISTWFNCATTSFPEGLVNIFSTAQIVSGFNDGWYVASLFSANRYIGWYIDGGWRATSNFVWNINTWYNLVATVQGRVYRYYLNGSLIFTYTSSNDPRAVGLGTIGRMHGLNARYFPGLISQYFAYNRALSLTEVVQNFNATKSRYGL